MSQSLATLVVEDLVATITMQRPEALNAIDLPLALELERLARQVSTMEEVRVLVLQGAGKLFSAGGDLVSFIPHLADMSQIVTPELNALHGLVLQMRTMPKIVLTSVQGGAAGGGMSLALAGDLCIASSTARFTTAYRKVGVSPDVGGSHSLVHSIGVKRTAQIYFGEKSVSAQQAFDWGMINYICDAADLEVETRSLARRLAEENQPKAIQETKTLIYRSYTSPLADQLAHEMRSLLVCMAEESFAAALNQFAEAPKAGAKA